MVAELQAPAKIFGGAQYMIARLLSILPGWVTGRAGPRASREVNGWTKDNATLRNFRYWSFRRYLLWSADHPVIFCLLTGAISGGVAYVSAGHSWDGAPYVPGVRLDERFDLAEYTGVPWSVQATLVALVYPLVLSFVALMLQRRAHSTVALRVYVLDSAVVPAGASSIGLLLVMGMQYFATPYSTPIFLAEHMALLLVLNGTWFASNVFLTGFFLSRTVRFIQEEEQRHAYTRIAVDVVLRSELTSAMTQHISVNAPYADWGFKIDSAGGGQPQVRMFRLGDGEAAVKRDLKGSLVLHDVHLHLIKWTVRSWCKRARVHQQTGRNGSVISFPPMVGQSATSQVVLCLIENGPMLTAFEKMLVRAAFIYRPYRQGTFSLTTKKMLEEIATEVEAAAEQHRFGAAEDGLRNVIRLHKTLLLASAVSRKGAAENAATLGTSPYAWGENSFAVEWLNPYREIGRIGVRYLDEDARIFRRLAIVPASIAAELPAKPEKLVIDSMRVGQNLIYQLSNWWTRKADASLAPGETTFNGTLPAPLSKIYEQALIAFVGSWGSLRIREPENEAADVSETWAVFAARALVYAKHIENSGEMFLNAVSRGDEVAAAWWLDSFIKWWGNRQYELEYGDLDEFQVRHVTLSLADKAWPDVQNFLWDGETPVTIDLACKALSLAVRRYWETMRLHLAFLLIQKAGPRPASDCRELRFAAALIKGRAQHLGGSIDCWPLDGVDAVITAILDSAFGVETVVSRIDRFVENLQRDGQTPQVSGWIYSWSGTSTDFESMKRVHATLLIALAMPRRRCIGKSKILIESWWRDLDKLESVGRYCQDLCREVLSTDFDAAVPTVIALQTHLGTTAGIRSARFAVVRAMKALGKVALHERVITLRSLDVEKSEVLRLAATMSVAAFSPDRWKSLPGTTVEFVPGMVANPLAVTFDDSKKHYVLRLPQQPDFGLAEQIAEHVWHKTLLWSLSKRLTDAGIEPANSLSLRTNYQATVAEQQSFISTVAALSAVLRSTGSHPVVLCGRGGPSSYLRPYKWGDGYGKSPLPSGITLRNGDPSQGESAVVFINETPVYQFDTPNADCYVVPFVMVKTLEIGGAGLSSALSISWTQLSDHRLNFVVSWNARFAEVA
jgi:hypothetical protein